MLQVTSIMVVIIAMLCVVWWGKRKLSPLSYSCMLWIMLIMYVAGALYCTLFSRVPGSGLVVELRPFMSFVRLFDKPGELAGEVTGFFAWFMRSAPSGSGIILNILLFVPLGFMLPVRCRKLTGRQVILIGCIFSVAIELIQYVLEMGYCETDDVIHNTLGTVMGVWMWHVQCERINRKESSK